MELQVDGSHGLMISSLEIVADRCDDIVPVFFERFFESFPDEQRNFINPGHAKGAMINEMLSMLIASAAKEDWVPTMLRIQFHTHNAYGDIERRRYADALTVLIDVLQAIAGDDWTRDMDAAWRGQAASMSKLIEAF